MNASIVALKNSISVRKIKILCRLDMIPQYLEIVIRVHFITAFSDRTLPMPAKASSNHHTAPRCLNKNYHKIQIIA